MTSSPGVQTDTHQLVKLPEMRVCSYPTGERPPRERGPQQPPGTAALSALRPGKGRTGRVGRSLAPEETNQGFNSWALHVARGGFQTL